MLTDGRDYTAIKPRAVRRTCPVCPQYRGKSKMGRKRQRSLAALTDADNDEQPVATIDESESTQDPDRGSKSQTDELPEERKKELDIWDAFKEEHHEGSFPTHPRRVHTPTFLVFSSRTAAVVVASPVQADARIGLSGRRCVQGVARIGVSDTFASCSVPCRPLGVSSAVHSPAREFGGTKRSKQPHLCRG